MNSSSNADPIHVKAGWWVRQRIQATHCISIYQ